MVTSSSNLALRIGGKFGINVGTASLFKVLLVQKLVLFFHRLLFESDYAFTNFLLSLK